MSLLQQAHKVSATGSGDKAQKRPKGKRAEIHWVRDTDRPENFRQSRIALIGTASTQWAGMTATVVVLVAVCAP